MSKTVDERVVSMQFDNRHFENNVKTSMGTLDKLKQKLNLSGASKGLENVNSAAKKVDLSGLGGAVASVGAKFSSLQVMAVTALANITNSAVNAGKQMLASLTIQPVTTGFREYELKMGSIQTIMASTGESLETVNGYLNELNEYSDKTIYSFSDMTQNIGKFTNAGVKLEDAVLAIKGISNEAALSGANANEASRAMYNFAQALSAGYVKLIDWKSIENANMATVGFKQELINAAVAAGTLKKSADGMYTTLEGKTISATKNFNDSLQDQWMTTEVLVNTLKDYADEETAIGKKAYAAAQDVKTFSMMMDTLRESAQSGWAQTWELIVGDYDQAKNLFTRLSKFFGDIIEKTAAARNAIVKGAMSSSWDKLTAKINKAGISTKDFTDKLRETAKKHNIDLDKMIEKEGSLAKVIEKGLISKDLLIETIKDYAAGLTGSSKQQEDLTEKLKYFQKVVDKVWHGDYKNGKARVEALTKAGYDYSKVQDLVNKTVDGHRLTLADLNETQLKSVGYTDEQIASIKKLAAEAEKAGTPLNELLESLEKPSGRELLEKTGKNLKEAISKPLNAIKEAWKKTFTKDGETVLYNLIEKLAELSEKLIMSEENADNFQKVFEGLFAGFQLANLAIGGGIMAVLKIASAVLSLFGTDLLTVGANIADWIIKLRDWLEANTMWVNSYGKIAKVIKAVIDGIWKFIQAIWNLKPVQDFISKLSQTFSDMFGGMKFGINDFKPDALVKKIEAFFTKLEKWAQGIENAENIGLYILQGIGNGLKKGGEWVITAIKSIANLIIDTFCGLFNIDSPSKLFFAFGGFIIAGLILGLKDGFGPISDTMQGLGSNILDFIKNLNIGAVLSSAFGVGLLYIAKRVLDLADSFAALPKGIGKYFSAIGESALITAKSNALEKKSKAILNFALAIGILAISLTLLSRIEWDKLWKAGVVMLVLMGALLGVAAAMSKLSAIGNLKEAAGMLALGTTLVSMSAALLLIAVAMKIMSGISEEDAGKVLMMMTTLLVGFVGLMVFARVAGDAAKGAGKMIYTIAGALLIITLVLKILGSMNEETATKGVILMSAIGALFVGFIAISKLAGEYSARSGRMLFNIAAAFVIIALAVKIIGGLEVDVIKRGLLAITALGGVFAGLIAISRFSGENATKSGIMMLSIALSLLLAVKAMKMVAELSGGEIVKGLAVVSMIGALFAGIIAVSYYAGEHAMKAGVMLALMSAALLILSGAIAIIGGMSGEQLTKALGVIFVLETLFAGLIAVSYLSKDCEGTLKMMAITIAVLVAAVIALTFIDEGKLKSATIALSGVLTAFALVVAATNFAKDTKGMLKRLALWVGIVVILSGVVLGLGHLSPEQALSAAGALSLLLTSFAGSLFILAKSGRVSSTVYTAIWSMLAVVAGLATVIAGLAMLPNPTSLISTTTALSILLTSFAGSLFILAKSGRISSTVHAPIYTMLAVVGGLATVLAAMSFLPDVSNLIPTAEALSILITAMSGALFALSLVSVVGGKVPAGVMGSFAILGLVVGEIATILGVINAVGLNTTVEQAAALSTLLIGMSAACFIVSKIPAQAAVFGALGCAAFIGIMGSVVAGLGALTKIKGFKEMMADGGEQLVQFGYTIGKFTGATLGGTLDGVTMGLPAMAENLSGFATALKPFLDTITGIDPDVATGAKLLAETILILATAGLVDSLSALIGGDSSLTSFAQQLIPFAYAMVEFSSIVAGNIDSSAVTAAASAGKMLAEMAAAVPNSGGLAGFFAGNNDINDFGAMLVPFGTAMVRFSAIVAGKIDKKAVEAAASAGQTMVALADTVPNTGGVVSWFAGNNDLNDFGAMLVPFGTAMVRFSAIVKGKIDQKAVKAAKAAGDTMVALANTLPNSGGVLGFFVGNNDINEFGAKLVPFGTAMVRFSSIVAGKVDKKAVDAARAAGDTMVALANTLPNSGGVVSWFAGDNDLSKFGKSLVSFAGSLVEFSKSLTGVDTTAMTKSTDAAYTVIKIAKDLPKEEMNFDVLTTGLNSFGDSMIDFTNCITGKLDLEAIDTAVWAVKTLAEAADIMPDAVDFEMLTNGLSTFGQSLVDFSGVVSSADTTAIDVAAASGKKIVDMIAGMPAELDVSKFAQGIALLGIAIRDFSVMGGEGAFNADGFDTILKAGKKITKMVENIPDYVDLTDFINNIPTLGNAIVTFSKAAGEDGINFDSVKALTKSGKKIINMMTEIPDYVDITDFINSIPALGEAIISFAKKAGEEKIYVDEVRQVTKSGKLIAGLVDKIPDYVDITDFSNSLPKLAKSLKDFIADAKGIKKNSADNVAKVGQSLITTINLIANSAASSFANTMQAASVDVTKACTTMISTAAKNIKTKTNYDAFVSIGKYLCQGVAVGISSNSYMVNTAARKMATGAYDIVKSILRVNSPSKVFMGIGSSIPEGFAMGIDKLSGSVDSSATNMATSAISNVRGAIARIADFVNNDIDAQPTIRPVLDLSDVRTGANAIGGMLNGNRRLAINAAGIGAISASMAGYQNGGNADIISSINALRKDINGMPRNSYNINGITYDDGSNITEAVKTLVRAAKIERRT